MNVLLFARPWLPRLVSLVTSTVPTILLAIWLTGTPYAQPILEIPPLPPSDVAPLQTLLHDMGLEPGTIDGVAGPATLGAVRRFCLTYVPACKRGIPLLRAVEIVRIQWQLRELGFQVAWQPGVLMPDAVNAIASLCLVRHLPCDNGTGTTVRLLAEELKKARQPAPVPTPRPALPPAPSRPFVTLPTPAPAPPVHPVGRFPFDSSGLILVCLLALFLTWKLASRAKAPTSKPIVAPHTSPATPIKPPLATPLATPPLATPTARKPPKSPQPPKPRPAPPPVAVSVLDHPAATKAWACPRCHNNNVGPDPCAVCDTPASA